MKTSIWMRLLALVMICVLMVGCLAGCDGSDAGSDGDRKKDKADQLRDDLVKYKYQGLLVYLGEEMSELEDGYSVNEDETLSVSVFVMDPEDVERDFGEGIDSPADMVESAKELISENAGEVIASGKKNGVYYVHAKMGGSEGVVGLYHEDGYWWAVSVIIEDEDLADTAIKYATLCEIASEPNLKEEDRVETAPTTRPSQGADVESSGDFDVPDYPQTEQAKRMITLRVWAPANMIDDWLYERMDDFEDAHPEYLISWEVEDCSEYDAGNMIASDPYAAADVFMFANDQIGMLAQIDALAPLSAQYRDQVIYDNTATMVGSVTNSDGEIYGFPVACNTWYMYYDNRVFSEYDVKSLDTMLSKGKVAFDFTNGWYNGAFLFGAGATLFGYEGADGYEGVNFGGQTGTAVVKKMLDMYNGGNLVDAGGGGMSLLIDGAVGACFSGSWDYGSLKTELGDNLGVAALPTFTVEDNTYRMKAFAGSKAIGVNGTISDYDKATAAMEFAAFLANEESQALRMDYYGITPVHINLMNSAMVRNSPVAQAEMEVIRECSIVQPFIPEMSAFWTPMANFGAAIINGNATYDNAGELLQQVEDQINQY